MANPEINPESIPSPFVYQEQYKPVLCSNLTCSNGHAWPLEIQVTSCPGCKSPILAVKMVNCPICNEPSASMALRIDHLSRGQAITSLCRGSASLADTHQIELKLTHAQDEQEKHKIREMPGKV
jgi:hypothetical protein